MLGVPGLAEKSSISSFRRIPVPGTVKPVPYLRFNVYVLETAFPYLSITEKWVVSLLLSNLIGSPGKISMLGVALLGLILRLNSSAYRFEIKLDVGTFIKPGSPKYLDRSA